MHCFYNIAVHNRFIFHIIKMLFEDIFLVLSYVDNLPQIIVFFYLDKFKKIFTFYHDKNIYDLNILENYMLNKCRRNNIIYELFNLNLYLTAVKNLMFNI